MLLVGWLPSELSLNRILITGKHSNENGIDFVKSQRIGLSAKSFFNMNMMN